MLVFSSGGGGSGGGVLALAQPLSASRLLPDSAVSFQFGSLDFFPPKFIRFFMVMN